MILNLKDRTHAKRHGPYCTVISLICELTCDTLHIASHGKDVGHSEQLKSEMPLLRETLKEMTSYILNTTNKYVMHTITN